MENMLCLSKTCYVYQKHVKTKIIILCLPPPSPLYDFLLYMKISIFLVELHITIMIL